jgi:isoleucyl-tRNA synthetase
MIRSSRERVTESIEPLRREKVIGSSLEAEVAVPEQELSLIGAAPAELAEIYIVSKVEAGASDTIAVQRSDYNKCGRCWRLLPEVTEDGSLCARCDEVVNG